MGKLVLAGIVAGMLVILVGFSWYQVNVAEITDSNLKRSSKLEKVLFILEFSEKVQAFLMPPNDVLSHTANSLLGNREYEKDFIGEEWENKKLVDLSLEAFYKRNSEKFNESLYKEVQEKLLEVRRLSMEIFSKMDKVRSLSPDEINKEVVKQEYKGGVILMEQMDKVIDDILINYLTPQSRKLAAEYQDAFVEDQKAQDSAYLKVVVAVVAWEVALIVVGFIGMVAVGRGEEQRRQLQQSEEKFRTIVRTATEGFCFLDANLIALDVNEALCTILGYERHEITKQSASKFLSKEALSRLKEKLTSGTGAQHNSYEIILLKKDGSEAITIFNVTVLHDHLKFPTHIFAFITDITERKKAEAALLSEKKDMELALSQAAEVLRFLSKEPQLTPYFEASPVYHCLREVGGGDIVRWLTFRKRYAGLYLHDVSGHDIHALLMNILATGIADHHKIDPAKKAVSVPSVFLREMNRELLEFSNINSRETSMFLTAVYVLMDFQTRTIKLSLAGHSQATIICPDGVVKKIGESGPLLGVFEVGADIDAMYKDVSFTLKEGELLFIHSDGLTEEENEEGIPFKDKLFQEVIPSVAGLCPKDACRRVREAFEAYRGDTKPDDDVSFVFLGTRPENKYESVEFLPGPSLVEEAIESIINVRQSATEEMIKAYRESGKSVDMEDVPVIDILEDAYHPIIEKLIAADWPEGNINKVSLVLHEMLMNGIIHGNLGSDRHSMKLRHVLHNDVLEVEVEDKGQGFAGSNLSQVIDEENIYLGYGRGLHLLKEYADRVYYSDSGSTCWALFKKRANS